MTTSSESARIAEAAAKERLEGGADTPEIETERKTTATRARKQGKSVYVTLTDAHYKHLAETADGRPLGVWLSKIAAKAIAALKGETE